MYVCLCTGVTSAQIEEAITQGATTAAQITALTGAGSNCGSCLNTVVAMMLKSNADSQILVQQEEILLEVNLPAPTPVFSLPMLSAA